jgi:hypothetical protein
MKQEGSSPYWLFIDFEFKEITTEKGKQTKIKRGEKQEELKHGSQPSFHLRNQSPFCCMDNQANSLLKVASHFFELVRLHYWKSKHFF